MEKRKIIKSNSGFTLIELLIVVAIIAILAGFLFVALNPLARFQDTRNARRWADINMIISAAKLHQVNNGGNYLPAIADLTPDMYYQIGTGNQCADSCENPSVVLQSDCVNLEELVNKAYMPVVPIDPNAEGASADETRYYLVKDSYGRLIVGACAEEQGSNDTMSNIEVTR